MMISEENQAKQVTPKAVYKELFSSFSMWLSLWYCSIPIFCLCKNLCYCFTLVLGERFENCMNREKKACYTLGKDTCSNITHNDVKMTRVP